MRAWSGIVLGTVLVACSSSTTPGTGSSSSGGSSSGNDQPTDEADAGGSTGSGGETTCLGAGGNCRDDANACCSGFSCVYDTTDPSKSVCASTCLSGDQCNSGCCTTLIEGTSKVCAPAKYCAGSCASPGQNCETTPCCGTGVCVNSTVTGISCAARCTTSSQCQSGCCAPLNNTGELVCSPVTFCQ